MFLLDYASSMANRRENLTKEILNLFFFPLCSFIMIKWDQINRDMNAGTSLYIQPLLRWCYHCLVQLKK